MDPISIGIISSIIGGIVVICVQKLVKSIKEKSNPYTGKWENHIYDNNGTVIKRDVIDVRQNGIEMNGTIKREFPPDQIHRRWEMTGRIVGKDFFAIFWSTDPTINSYGSWYVHYKNDFLFEGYYLKLNEKAKHGVSLIRLDFVKSNSNKK